MTKDEALRMALDALEEISSYYMSLPKKGCMALAAIEEVLAQPDPSAYWHSEFLKHNTTSEQPAQQEPVAVIDSTISGNIDWRCVVFPKDGAKLYTAPPQRKPLTDEEIILIVAECAASHQHTDIHFARAIERAHGIKELV